MGINFFFIHDSYYIGRTVLSDIHEAPSPGEGYSSVSETDIDGNINLQSNGLTAEQQKIIQDQLAQQTKIFQDEANNISKQISDVLSKTLSNLFTRRSKLFVKT